MERNPKILVVVDDPRLRDLLRRYLGENGFQVFVSENGAAMSRLWVREHFDALILDLMMPGEDGLQILRRLRAAKDMTPVIMLTARGEDVDRIVGLELGADAVRRATPRALPRWKTRRSASASSSLTSAPAYSRRTARCSRSRPASSPSSRPSPAIRASRSPATS